MKRIITVTVFFLFLASVAVFMAFGPQIRAVLSPQIRYEYPVIQESDGQLMTAIPVSAVWTGEDGESYAWRVSRSDEFPESTFVVNAVTVTVDHEADGLVYFGYGFGGLSQSDAVAVAWPGTLKEGMCVRPGR